MTYPWDGRGGDCDNIARAIIIFYAMRVRMVSCTLVDTFPVPKDYKMERNAGSTASSERYILGLGTLIQGECRVLPKLASCMVSI